MFSLSSGRRSQMVAMTGSTATGKNIMGSCSGELKRLVLEVIRAVTLEGSPYLPRGQ